MVQKKIDEALKNIKSGIGKFIDQGWKEQNTDDPEGTFDDTDTPSEFRINEAVSNKIHKIIKDFIESAPLIESAGFRIKDMEIELSIIPKLIPHFEKIANTDNETRLSIIEQVKDKRLVSLLLKALFKADNFQQSLKMGPLEFAGIEIEITAIPAIRLIYKNPKQTKINITDLVE
ncbi:MAG: hypothetical protein GY829_11470 [Gammaproteobacteria bacterium]|nr:hypothetical protein [Gammaproteobacteria bacterium]